MIDIKKDINKYSAEDISNMILMDVYKRYNASTFKYYWFVIDVADYVNQLLNRKHINKKKAQEVHFILAIKMDKLIKYAR